MNRRGRFCEADPSRARGRDPDARWSYNSVMTPRERLRTAAASFAENIYELLRADVGAAVAAPDRSESSLTVRDLVPSATLPDSSRVPETEAPVAIRPKRRTTAGPSEALIKRVVAFVTANPACRFKQVRAAVPFSESALETALKVGRERGLIRLEGVKIKARYFPVTPASEAPAASEVASDFAPVTRDVARAAADEAAASLPAVDLVFEELDRALAGDMHPMRLGAVLQSVVAKVRQLQRRFPQDHPARRRLDDLIRRVTIVRAERDLAFIQGLRRDATANWEIVGRDALRRVAAFDAEAMGQAASSTPHAQPPMTDLARGARASTLPRLVALSSEESVVLVGGVIKNDVLDHVRIHHGLAAEWVGLPGTDAHASRALVERIRSGRVGAVVVLEGLTASNQIKTVVDACKDASVPFAYGGRGSGESLQSALSELESRAAGIA